MSYGSSIIKKALMFMNCINVENISQFKTISSCAISTASITGRAALGSFMLPGIGKIIGTVTGAVIGVFSSYSYEQQIEKLFKVNIETDIDEAYKELNIDKNKSTF
ncbi:hypothetical protein ABPG72_006423 [Tetrahymena utriculariae]